MMKALIVIPARLESTRLPRKMLLEETGKPLVQHTYEAALRSCLASRVIVATDSLIIQTRLRASHVPCVMTLHSHTCGTDRVAQVSQLCPDNDVVLNLQGDEPEMPPEVIDMLLDHMAANETESMATAAAPLPAHRRDDKFCVKVVKDGYLATACPGYAIYFGREPSPLGTNLAHLGIYAYRRENLRRLAEIGPHPWETTHGLEQLRALQWGLPIAVLDTEQLPQGIDTRADYDAFVARYNAARASTIAL